MTALFAYRVELYLGSTLGWVDITHDVRGPVTITRGRTSEGNRADPGRCTMRLDNLSGDYSPGNPAGQWYGLLGRNTPLRVSAGLAGGALSGRFYGEVAAWPPGWNLVGTDRYVDVEAGGILRRMGQGEQPKWSAMRRTIGGASPLAYWPLEDGTEAGQGGSALSGVPAMQVAGSAPFDDIETWTARNGYTVAYGTAALADVSKGTILTAAVPATATSATATGWTLSVSCDFALGSDLLADFVLAEVETPGGTFVRWRLVLIQSAFDVQLIAYDANGAGTVVFTDTAPFTSLVPHNLAVWQNGANINAGYIWDSSIGYEASGSVAGTLAGVARVTVNPTKATANVAMPVGHVALWAGHDLAVVDFHDGPVIMALFSHSWTNINSASAAATGEAADQRLVRLCTEAGIPVDTFTADPDPVLMGPQPAAKLADLLDQCTDADGGYLHESRTALGLAYRTRGSLYNQTPVAIDYVGQLAPPFAPDPSGDDVRNDVTVKRTDGSSARVVEATGRLAAVPPPDGVGVYQTSVELNLADDSRLADQAGWRVHLGTVDADRYPALSVQFAAPQWQADPAGMADVLAVDTGDVLEVTGLPSWAAGDARTLALGYSETFDEWLWAITFAGVPAQPWDVGEADGDAPAAADGTTLAAALAAPAAPVVWDFTASSGVLGWSAIGGSVAINAGSLRFTPNGTSASVEARSPNTPVTAGKLYAGTATATCAVSRTVTPLLIWRDASGTLLSSTAGTGVAVTAGVPVDFTVTGTAPVGATQAQVSLSMGSTPPSSNTLSVDVAQLGEAYAVQITSTAANGQWTTDPADFPLNMRIGAEQVTASAISGTGLTQTATVYARAVNGVTAAWPAGTEVDVWLPAVAAL